MKRILLLLLIVFSNSLFSQSLNDYQYVIVPIRYDFMKNDNEYRLNTITKYNLEKMGFQAFYNDINLPKQIASNTCDALKVDVVKSGSFIWTNLTIVFKDCQNNIVYQSEIGKSKEKDFTKSYTEALEMAFASVYLQGYNYNPSAKKTEIDNVEEKLPFETKVVTQKVYSENTLKALAIPGGYNLVDKTENVIFKLTSSGKSDFYLAQKGTQSGLVFQKGTDWFFEFEQNGKLISEKIEIQF